MDVSEGFGQSVSVRRDEVDTIEYNRDKGVGVTIYDGQKRGYASTSDFSKDALKATVDAAVSIARFTAPTPPPACPRPCWPATAPDFDLYHPWKISTEEAIEAVPPLRARGLRGEPGDPQLRGRQRVDAGSPISSPPTAWASWAATPARATTCRAR